MVSRCVLTVLTAFVLPLLAACQFPMDADGTLKRVRAEGVLRVGVSENPPWVVAPAGDPSGMEADLVRAWAEDLGARIEWVRGSESTLVSALRERRLDLVIGGFTSDSPWRGEASASLPFRRDHVMLAPAGESAFLFALDRFLVEARREGRIVPANGT